MEENMSAEQFNDTRQYFDDSRLGIQQVYDIIYAKIGTKVIWRAIYSLCPSSKTLGYKEAKSRLLFTELL